MSKTDSVRLTDSSRSARQSTSVSSSSSSSSSSTSSSSSSSSSSASISLFRDFAVVAIPEKHLAFTNCAFLPVATQDLLTQALKKRDLDQDTYVQIKNLVLTVRPHAALQANTIGLGVRHRESLGLPASVDDEAPLLLNFRPFIIPKNGSHSLTMIQFRLEPIDLPRKTLVKETDIMAFIRDNYRMQVFTRGQIIVIQFEGRFYNIVVEQLQAFKVTDKADSTTTTTKKGNNKNDDEEEETLDDEELLISVDQGLLLSGTDVEVTAAEHKFLKFDKNANRNRSKMFDPNWKFESMGIGGLDNEFASIFRRAFASRLFPPDVIADLGIQHVRGMLLYGPPGTGKTLIARQIGKMLGGKVEPLVVNGPEVLNKYVGASEENIRKLFEPAEVDYKANKENADLHIIIFDEIDAICKARGSTSGGTGVQDTVVNQLLSKMDGVNSLNNILVIGMTNRKDMLDPALMRPGRLEVHVPINLPNEEGRRQILGIHLKPMKDNGKLGANVDVPRLAALTKNFSPAELVGLIKSATSYALYGCIDTNKGGKGAVGVKAASIKRMVVTMNDFLLALSEVTPAFGVQEDALRGLVHGGLYDYGVEFQRLITTLNTLAKQVVTSSNTRLLSVLLEGPPGSGKTAIAASIGLSSMANESSSSSSSSSVSEESAPGSEIKNSIFPFVKVISPEQYLGMGEAGKSYEISRIFDDAYKSPLSLIILDSIERLLDYTPLGPRFSNTVLQALTVLTSRRPPNPKHKLFIIGTTADVDILQDMQLKASFNVVHSVPMLNKLSHFRRVFELTSTPISASELGLLQLERYCPMSIKTLLFLVEMAKQESGPDGPVTAEYFEECVRNAGLWKYQV